MFQFMNLAHVLLKYINKTYLRDAKDCGPFLDCKSFKKFIENFIYNQIFMLSSILVFGGMLGPCLKKLQSSRLVVII